MNWKHIKTVLIFLFLIINIYLIYTSPTLDFSNTSVTHFDEQTNKKTAVLIEKNYGVSIKKNIIPKKIKNIKNINATNIIYTDKFVNSKYEFTVQNGQFTADIPTKVYSYNESSARNDINKFLENIGINEKFYSLSFSKSDSGLVCIASEKISDYKVFNCRIKAVFSASEMHVSGKWYIPESEKTASNDSSLKMKGISGILLDAAEKISAGSSGSEIVSIQYGYYLSYYDENTVSKSASAIPCYMIATDSGFKYYYDAINGKTLKQEE